MALLDGRAFDGTEGAEDAAVAGAGAEDFFAGGALVEEEAGVGGHELDRGVVAVGAGEGGVELDGLGHGSGVIVFWSRVERQGYDFGLKAGGVR